LPGTRVQDGAPLPTFFPSNVTAGFLGVITTPGTYQTSIRVTDSTGSFIDRPITIIVSPLSILSQNQLPRPARNAPYSFTFTPFGGGGLWLSVCLDVRLRRSAIRIVPQRQRRPLRHAVVPVQRFLHASRKRTERHGTEGVLVVHRREHAAAARDREHRIRQRAVRLPQRRRAAWNPTDRTRRYAAVHLVAGERHAAGRRHAA